MDVTDTESDRVRRMRNPGQAIALALVVAACGPTPGHSDDAPDGGGGGGGGDGGDTGNPNSQGCSDDAKLIYVVDQAKHLLQFDPKTKAFKDLGILPCSSSSTPFSMGIARDASAWILYGNGELFHVDTKNNLACTKSAWVPNTQGELKFGMGFSTDQAGGTSDTLFISGGSSPDSGSTSKLAKLDTGSFQATPIGTVTGWPELTGTGNAELWGFFPGGEARIEKIDKANGAALATYRTSRLDDPWDDPTAWAFAFHGGFFWVFLQKSTDGETHVYQYDAMNGAYIGTTDSGGRKIVGAGVSTCAPVIIL